MGCADAGFPRSTTICTDRAKGHGTLRRLGEPEPTTGRCGRRRAGRIQAFRPQPAPEGSDSWPDVRRRACQSRLGVRSNRRDERRNPDQVDRAAHVSGKSGRAQRAPVVPMPVARRRLRRPPAAGAACCGDRPSTRRAAPSGCASTRARGATVPRGARCGAGRDHRQKPGVVRHRAGHQRVGTRSAPPRAPGRKDPVVAVHRHTGLSARTRHGPDHQGPEEELDLVPAGEAEGPARGGHEIRSSWIGEGHRSCVRRR